MHGINHHGCFPASMAPTRARGRVQSHSFFSTALDSRPEEEADPPVMRRASGLDLADTGLKDLSFSWGPAPSGTSPGTLGTKAQCDDATAAMRPTTSVAAKRAIASLFDQVKTRRHQNRCVQFVNSCRRPFPPLVPAV